MRESDLLPSATMLISSRGLRPSLSSSQRNACRTQAPSPHPTNKRWSHAGRPAVLDSFSSWLKTGWSDQLSISLSKSCDQLVPCAATRRFFPGGTPLSPSLACFSFMCSLIAPMVCLMRPVVSSQFFDGMPAHMAWRPSTPREPRAVSNAVESWPLPGRKTTWVPPTPRPCLPGRISRTSFSMSTSWRRRVVSRPSSPGIGTVTGSVLGSALMVGVRQPRARGAGTNATACEALKAATTKVAIPCFIVALGGRYCGGVRKGAPGDAKLLFDGLLDV
mmetsp:Transcript_87213/g.247652  ORF Transcript_87213/g.247652 Transcript_87213/m.247652 type:complete len:276 (-) Transcript_87213:1188-2015(-)